MHKPGLNANNGERYRYTDEDTINLLAGLGYRIADRVNRDVIFTI